MDKTLTIDGLAPMDEKVILNMNREDNYNGHTAYTFDVDAILPSEVIGRRAVYEEEGTERISCVIYQADTQNRVNTTTLQGRDFMSWGSLILELLDAVSRDLSNLIGIPTQVSPAPTPSQFHVTLNEIVRVRGFPLTDEGVEDPRRERVVRTTLVDIVLSEMREAKDEAEALRVLDKYWLEYYRDSDGDVHVTSKVSPEDTYSLMDDEILDDVQITYRNKDGGGVFTAQNRTNQQIVDAILGSVRAQYKVLDTDELDFFPVSTYTNDLTITLGETYNGLKEAFRAVIVESMNTALEQNVLALELNDIVWDIPTRTKIEVDLDGVPFSTLVVKRITRSDSGGNRSTIIEAVPELDVAILPVMETALRWATPIAPTITFRHHILESGEIGPPPPILTCGHAQVAWTRPVANNEFYNGTLLVGPTEIQYGPTNLPPDTISLILEGLSANTQYQLNLRAQNSLTRDGVIDIPDASTFAFSTPNEGPRAPERCSVSNWERLRNLTDGSLTFEEFEALPSSVFSPPTPPQWSREVVGDGVRLVEPIDPLGATFGEHVEGTRNQRGGSLVSTATYHGGGTAASGAAIRAGAPLQRGGFFLINRVNGAIFKDFADGPIRTRIQNYLYGRFGLNPVYNVDPDIARSLAQERIIGNIGRFYASGPARILGVFGRIAGWIGTVYSVYSLISNIGGGTDGAVIRFDGNSNCVHRIGTITQLRYGFSQTGTEKPTEDSVNWEIAIPGTDAEGWTTIPETFDRSNPPIGSAVSYYRKIIRSLWNVVRFGYARALNDDEDVFIVRNLSTWDTNPDGSNTPPNPLDPQYNGYVQVRMAYRYSIEEGGTEQTSNFLNSPVLDMRNYAAAAYDRDYYP